jgi:hypothetical protein
LTSHQFTFLLCRLNLLPLLQFTQQFISRLQIIQVSIACSRDFQTPHEFQCLF